MPDGEGVLASDMHIVRGPEGISGKPGSLKWLDRKTGTVTVLYPSSSATGGKSIWGDADCTEEIGSKLLPHGFHLSRRGDGAWQLLVVNHGGRESVEFFELTGEAGNWALNWRGCVIPPAPNRLNDVVALPGGGLLVTTMYRQAGETADDRAKLGENTGFLWRWMPDEGYSEQAGSESPRPNGVQIDADARFAFVSTAAGGGEVRKLDLQAGRVVGSVAVPRPDNSSWTRDGRLLVTGMVPDADSGVCFAAPEKTCMVAFEVHRIDPVSMESELLFAHKGPPMGAATVAVQHGDDLLIGTFAGDRIMAAIDIFKDAPRSGEAGSFGEKPSRLPPSVNR